MYIKLPVQEFTKLAYVHWKRAEAPSPLHGTPANCPLLTCSLQVLAMRYIVTHTFVTGREHSCRHVSARKIPSRSFRVRSVTCQSPIRFFVSKLGRIETSVYIIHCLIIPHI